MRAGDFLLVHSTGVFPWLIRVGERLHFKGKGSQWSHAALIVSDDGKTIEAQARGVVASTVSAHSVCQVVDSGLSDAGRQQVCRFAASCLGDEYGYLTLASIVLDLLTPSFLTFRRPKTLICSELVARSLEHGGWICPDLDTSQVMPSDLCRWFT